MLIHPWLTEDDVLIAQVSDEHGHGRLKMITDLQRRVNGMGDGFLSYLAIIATKIPRFGKRYRSDVKVVG